MANLEETHHLGDTVIHLDARGVEQAQPQVLLRLRLTEFYELSIDSGMVFLRFHLGQLSLPRAVPAIVSFVASNLDAKIRNLCEHRLLRFASQAAAETATGSALELLVDIGTFLAPGSSAQEVELIDEWMLYMPLEEDEEMAVVLDYYLEDDDGFGGVPASRSFIESLERLPYGGGEGVREGECVICMEDFDAGAEVSKTPCSHAFHSRCITQWLENSHLCPICRYHMPTQDQPI